MNLFSIKHDAYPLLKLAIPLAMAGMIQSAVWFFESIFLAHLGPDILAAGSLVSWLFGTVAVILYGILSSINILVALKHGEQNQPAIRQIARDGLLLAIIISIPTMILFWNMSPIFLTFGQSQEVVAQAKSYLQPLAWGLVPDFIIMACLEVIIGVGYARMVLVFSTITVVLNVICSYLLIFGKFNFPALGIAGAGWGMTISYWITFVILTAYILIVKKYQQYFQQIFDLTSPVYLVELLQIGVPMGLMYCVEVAFFFALTLVMGLLGAEAQAANQVALQYLGLMMSTMFAVAQAITVRMGHLLGANDYSKAGNASRVGIFIAIIFTGLIAIVYWTMPFTLIAIDFNIHDAKNHTIVTLIVRLISVCALFQIIESVRITLFGSLRALKVTKYTMLVSIISFWCVALPIGYFIAIKMQAGAAGFWWGMIMGASVSVVLLLKRFNNKMRTLALMYHASLR